MSALSFTSDWLESSECASVWVTFRKYPTVWKYPTFLSISNQSWLRKSFHRQKRSQRCWTFIYYRLCCFNLSGCFRNKMWNIVMPPPSEQRGRPKCSMVHFAKKKKKHVVSSLGSNYRDFSLFSLFFIYLLSFWQTHCKFLLCGDTSLLASLIGTKLVPGDGMVVFWN